MKIFVKPFVELLFLLIPSVDEDAALLAFFTAIENTWFSAAAELVESAKKHVYWVHSKCSK